MALQNRSSVCAIIEEVTEGTPVSPSSATGDYIALQDGFSISPEFAELTNDELTGSIAQAKSTLGLESPTASISHYVKHSGVEGTESNVGLFWESFFGAKTVAGAEYDTIAGSTAGDSTTRGTLVVDTGEGSNFERGQGVLIKSGVSSSGNYSVRHVQSVSTDTISMSFNTNSAAGTGVNLGQAILYKPANEDHPVMTVWIYRANGGFTEMVSGARVSTFTITATAGENVNADFELSGIEYYWNSVEITSSDVSLDFVSDNGTFVATVGARFYKDPHELASSLTNAMLAADPLETYLVVYSDTTGKYTISSSTSTIFELPFSTGVNAATSINDKIAFAATDLDSATTYTSDSVLDFSAPQTPVYNDSAPVVAKSNEVLLGDFDDFACYEASSVTINGTNTVSDLLSLCANSGKSGTLVTARELTIDVVARVPQYDADKFRRFRANENVQFAYTLGQKAGGDWVPGTVTTFYSPTAVISSYEVSDTDGVLEYNFTISTYVEDGLGEAYISNL